MLLSCIPAVTPLAVSMLVSLEGNYVSPDGDGEGGIWVVKGMNVRV